MTSLLLIDDDKMLSDSMQLLLQTSGYEVTCCDSGPEALKLAQDKRFHAAIVDYHLPGMNGAEITGKLRTQCPHTVIIGFSLDYKEHEFLGAGADSFFVKPDVTAILTRLNALG
jgi:DNA-binding response OmpR family regulator